MISIRLLKITRLIKRETQLQTLQTLPQMHSSDHCSLLSLYLEKKKKKKNIKKKKRKKNREICMIQIFIRIWSHLTPRYQTPYYTWCFSSRSMHYSLWNVWQWLNHPTLQSWKWNTVDLSLYLFIFLSIFFLLKTCVCLFLFIFTPHYSGSGEFKCSSIWIIWKGQSSWLDLPDGASEQKWDVRYW